MEDEIKVSKSEEEQQPIPSVWRQTIREIVEAFASNDFQLIKSISGVRQLSVEDAERISKSIESYGAHLSKLPEKAWETSVCQWMDGYWDVLIDLYTVEEGESDLVLSMRVLEAPQGYDFQIQSVYVP